VGNSGHTGSHLGLLSVARPPDIVGEKIDAIIVPSARTASYVRHAAGLAQELKCPLVVLCSHEATREAVVRDLEDNLIVVDIAAVDLPRSTSHLLPSLETSTMLAGTCFEMSTDTSLKRNLGLTLARTAGWTRVVFLDDDIEVTDTADLRRAAGLLANHDGVGLTIGGYPDNSVVCHAHRETGGWQETFVGGGALAVATDRVVSFFPKIYNEDWFFLLDERGFRPVVRVGKAIHRRYDPFARPDRAREEEFGDNLAEGVFALLDQGRMIQDANEEYWLGFLKCRLELINDVIERTAKHDRNPGQQIRMIASLEAARERLLLIDPTLCVAYLSAWQRDRLRWRSHLTALPTGLSIVDALSHLGLGQYAMVRLNRTGPHPKAPRSRIARRWLSSVAAWLMR
jgi:hypothetical protein